MFILLFLLAVAVAEQTNFAVVVDVGSTGSRVHAFQWRFDESGCGGAGAVKVTVPEKNSKIRPGFSTFFDSRVRELGQQPLEVITEYLSQIKTEADNLVPAEFRARTPVWMFGTAGMRHFNAGEKSLILQGMRDVMSVSWEYLTKPDWIDVLDGEREGLFSWVFLNQLLGRQISPSSHEILIEPSPSDQARDTPVAMVELGGASAQIVYQPPLNMTAQFVDATDLEASKDSHPVRPIKDHPGFHLVEFCGASSVVYARSFQGYGRQLALQRYLAGVNLTSLPCLPSDMIFPNFADQKEAMVAIEDIGKLDDGSEGLRGVANGTFNLCQQAVNQALFSDATLLLPFQFAENLEIVATESFYHLHRMVASPDPSSPPHFSIESVRKRAEALCQLSEVGRIVTQISERAEPEKATTACFGLTFIAEFLERVLGLPVNREITAMRKVGDTEIAWPAGLLLLELPHLLSVTPDLLNGPKPKDEL